MAYIQPNKLLPPTARVIRPYQCAFVAVEGPNILGKLNMSGVELPYDSQFSTRMTLNPGAVKQPLLYGFLGSEVTFVMLKITYDETDPRCNIEEEQFIEYYFETEPSIIRYANKLLLLTGNSVKRIPQIFLQNPSEVKVIVEALVANLEQDDIDLANVNVITIGNIYYNNVLSDTIWLQCDSSGSTQLQILGIDGYIQLYLDYIDILTVEPQYETNELKMTTVSDTTIILGFLSSFEMYQALSRISWVMKDPNERYLTKDYPGVDVTPPDFIYRSITPPITTTPYPFPYTSGTTLLPDTIINYFISGVTDARDGNIPVDSVYITIRQQGYVDLLTGITHVGVYDIVMSVNDLANNQRSINLTIVCDDVPPVIVFKAVAVGTGFTMTTSDMTLPSFGITPEDIRTKSVDMVYDTIDGTIPNSNVTIFWIDPISGFTPMTVITSPGGYELTYMVDDSAGNTFTSGKTMTYEGYKILDINETYTFPVGMVSMDFKFVGETGTTATIIISGETFVVACISGTSNSELVWDFGGPHEYNFGSGSSGSIQIDINGTLFTILFTGRASLNFRLTSNGPAIDYFEIIPTGLTFGFDTDSTNTFEIVTNCHWTLTDDIEWLLPSRTSGTGNATVTFTTMASNSSGHARTEFTVVTVVSATIVDPIIVTMTQETEFYFSVSPSAMTFAYYSGATQEFDITTNANWEIYDSVSWLDFDITSGIGNVHIIATTNEDNVGTLRTNKIFTIANIDTFHEVLDVAVEQEGSI